MSEPVRLYHVDGQVIDCAAPSEVVRLLNTGEWRREAWPVAPTPAPKVAPPADEELPFATPLPPEVAQPIGPRTPVKRGRPRKA